MSMKMFSLFLAHRYLRTSTQNVQSRTMILVCSAGIFIGSCALALTLAITSGFDKEIHTKMQSIHAPIIMDAQGQGINMPALSRILDTEFSDVVYAAHATEHIAVQAPGEKTIEAVMVLKGIDPVREARTSALEQKLLQGKLSTLLHANNVIIGTKAAQQLGVTVGDEITLIFVPETTDDHFQKKKVRVSGLIQTGIDDFDTTLMFCTYEFLTQLFPDVKPTTVHLATHLPEQEVIAQLKERCAPLQVYSWKDLYPALVSALKLEKYVMFFILMLISLVACMNIFSLLFMHITYKRTDFAVLLSIGCSRNIIRNICIFLGLSITLLSCIAGLITAYIICLFLQHYPLITLPDVYYVTHIPVHIDGALFVLVALVVTALGVIATWIPARRAQSLTISKVLRFEG